MADLDSASLFNVKGLVAVITGGGTGTEAYIVTAYPANGYTGIGLMMAQALEANGAIVYILGRRQDVLKKAASTAVRLLNLVNIS
jgi:NAD(P)-dependent dehydrogenase (short-subunit alcohol dehydrogenase family)